MLTGKPKSLGYGNPVGSLLLIYNYDIMVIGDGNGRNMERYKKL